MLKLKPFLTIIFSLSLAFAAPLAAQSFSLRNACLLLHFGEAGGPAHNAWRSVSTSNELLEMRIAYRPIKPDSTEYLQTVSKLGFASVSKWALVHGDSSGMMRTLAQWEGAPAIADIQNALADAGIKNPIAQLRDFLKKHPENLEARAELLIRLRQVAEQRTQLVSNCKSYQSYLTTVCP
ncbi:MAG: hypothetical protein LBH03_01435 [Holophagales bacterium]|jgi:hypothetical protein|nr:hypothetical protein [Holophagales bacterium]